MYSLNEIVQAIISRLPDVHTVTKIDMVERHGSHYVYFNYEGKRLRVDYSLSVEEVDRSMLCTSAFARNVQAVLRGDRDTLEDPVAKLESAINVIAAHASHDDLFEIMVGIGEPEEGTTEELREAFKAWLKRKDKSREDKVEIIRMFLGHEKSFFFEKETN